MGDLTPRVVIQTQEWYAVTGPVVCDCGHAHYGRILREGGANQSPQWRWCEDPTCTCHGLRARVGYPSAAMGLPRSRKAPPRH